MRASLRWTKIMLGGLLLVPGAAQAQSSSEPAPKSTPAPDSVGPQELQNFSLSGSVTKPADQQAEPAPVVVPPTSAAPAGQDATKRLGATGATAERTSSARKPERAKSSTAEVPAASGTLAAKPATVAVRSEANVPSATSADRRPAESTTLAPARFPSPAPNVVSEATVERQLPIWPWVLAGLAIAAGIFFLLWRRGHREAFAGATSFDAFAGPQPAPMPTPSPAPLRPASPEPEAARPTAEPAPAASLPTKPRTSGIVSKRLRPELEVDARPLQCFVDDERVIVEFELELFNSGTAPARAVLAEASLFNAGVDQEQVLASFFANPVGAGERLDAIPPMKRVTFMNKVVAPREAIQEYELGGRKVFVPVLAFNALYTWSGGDAQTSASYLVGRDTAGTKLAPLSLEGGSRQIRKLAARPLPTVVRT